MTLCSLQLWRRMYKQMDFIPIHLYTACAARQPEDGSLITPVWPHCLHPPAFPSICLSLNLAFNVYILCDICIRMRERIFLCNIYCLPGYSNDRNMFFYLRLTVFSHCISWHLQVNINI